MKKKKDFFDIVKTWWPLWLILFGFLGGLMTFSSQLQAMWKTPETLEETQKSVTELSENLNTYTAANEAEDKQRDELLKLLTVQAMNEQKKGWF